MEAELVPKHGYPISFINIAGLRNKNLSTWLKLPFKLLQSLVQSIKVIRAVNPDVVMGMGGYASAPGGVAAWLLRKPLVLHEQNAVAGLTNRYLSLLASQVLSAFPGAFKGSVKARVVGNPLRRLIVDLEKKVPEQPSLTKKVLVVGGSLGAKVLNDVVPQAMKQIKTQQLDIWHQTGRGNREQVLTNYCQNDSGKQKIKVSEFIDDMAEAYQWADVVICRAGALSVSELAMASKPAIFVPLPHAVDDHQTKNALYLVERGAAKLIPQIKFNGTTVAQMLNSLFISDKVLQSMANAAHDAAHADATINVGQTCIGLLKK